MKSFLTFLFSVIITNYSFSQRTCGSQDKLNTYLSENINEKQERDKIEKEYARRIKALDKMESIRKNKKKA